MPSKHFMCQKIASEGIDFILTQHITHPKAQNMLSARIWTQMLLAMLAQLQASLRSKCCCFFSIATRDVSINSSSTVTFLFQVDLCWLNNSIMRSLFSMIGKVFEVSHCVCFYSTFLVSNVNLRLCKQVQLPVNHFVILSILTYLWRDDTLQ